MPTIKLRRTKIIATLGPATDNPIVLHSLIEAGTNLVRLNFSHGDMLQHKTRLQAVRAIATSLNTEIGVIADLQGPKIRITAFKKGCTILLTPGQEFVLDTKLAPDAGDEFNVGLTYPELIYDVIPDDILLLDDGRLKLKVKDLKKSRIICEVQVGGTLSSHKGINRQGGGLAAPALTAKDKADLKIAADMEVDYIAISFPRDAYDIETARALLKKQTNSPGIIAKIERIEAVKNSEEIINAADAIMVARGDLAVEIGEEYVPGVQKDLIQKARHLNKAVITATQMMESMIHAASPTRAEVSDVANAILDGTDAVMLSAETAMGDHPALVVNAMAKICLAAEENPISQHSRHRADWQFQKTDEAIAMAAMYTANRLPIKAIICLTETGLTPLWMSRIRSGIPIFGLTRYLKTQRRMTLFRGVFPLQFDPTAFEENEVEQKAIDALIKNQLLKEKDTIIITHGNIMGTEGGTNTLKIVTV